MAKERKSRPSRSSRSDRSSPPTPEEDLRSSSRGRERSSGGGRDKERGRERSRERDGRDHHEEGDKSGKRHNLSVPICKDFTRGRCSRSPLECRYAHPPPSVDVEGETVTVCYDSLRDRCVRGLGCRYFHPPPHIRVSMQEAVGITPSPPSRYRSDEMRHSNILVPPARLPPPLPVVVPSSLKTTARPSIEVCRDFVRGRCNRDAEDCRYAHHTPSAGDGDYVIVCQDFVRGKCDRETCRYFHPPKYLRSRIRDLPLGGSSAFDLGRYEPSTLDAYSAFAGANLYEQQSSKRMRVDDSGRHRRRSSPGPLYGGGHVPPLYQAPPPPALKSSNANDQDKLPICRDFLRNKCDRESTCRYVHPDSHIQVYSCPLSFEQNVIRELIEKTIATV
ncbi:hypothetical protein O6H91_21G065000 [Diphasiastrum complanatum]|uniref:Uncharacterized protein n=1 Tax=Diphasiastrum complanatum TaxID=34168 RepID=A0ACC2ALL9_DIPCM|nr:hypothetical protein O6H91_21G065000 [Diphasiastrum complanatum]